MAWRNCMETPLIELLARQEALNVVILSIFKEDQRRILGLDAKNLKWAYVHHPSENTNTALQPPSLPVKEKLRQIGHGFLNPILSKWAGFGNLVFRFNHIHRFSTHQFLVHLPPARKTREAQAGNYVDDHLGQPFPDSERLLWLLYRFYYSTWQRNSPQVEIFFEQFRPHLVVISHVQNPTIKPYVVAATKRGIPILGMIGSWDQATTKGPLCPGIARYIVQTPIMRRELITYHNVPESKIEVAGWPQMDIYKKPGVIQPRESFLQSLGIPAENKILLFAANSSRLGAHEPSIMQYISRKLKANIYGYPCTLVIRPHPRDAEWQTRFSQMHDPPNAIVLPAEKGRLDFLANLLAHADVTLASSGSVALDSAALDTPVINIGFDGDLETDYYNSSLRFCETDHYVNVIQSGGVRLVKSYQELDDAVIAYLKDPKLDSAGRERLRQEQLEPFDGRASERILNWIIEEAYRAYSPHQPQK